MHKILMNGTPTEVLDFIGDKMDGSQTPLAVIGVLWSNDVMTMSTVKLAMILVDAGHLLDVYPCHHLAFPQNLYAPIVKQHFKRVRQANLLIASLNKSRGLGQYMHFKASISRGGVPADILKLRVKSDTAWDSPGRVLCRKERYKMYVMIFHLHNFPLPASVTNFCK